MYVDFDDIFKSITPYGYGMWRAQIPEFPTPHKTRHRISTKFDLRFLCFWRVVGCEIQETQFSVMADSLQHHIFPKTMGNLKSVEFQSRVAHGSSSDVERSSGENCCWDR